MLNELLYLTSLLTSSLPPNIKNDAVTTNLDLFSTDYWGPQSAPPAQGGNASPFHTLTNQIHAFYNQACGVTGFTNGQSSWFEITLSPNHDCTNRVPHLFCYHISINGPGTLSVSNRVAGFTTWQFNSKITGTIYDLNDQLSNWVSSVITCNFTNDVIFHFQYNCTGTVTSCTNGAGVWGLSWEAVTPQESPYYLRLEPEMINIGINDVTTPEQQGTVTHSVRLSWFGNHSSIHVFQTTNLVTGPWMDKSTNTGFPIWENEQKTGYILNYPVSLFSKPQKEFFKLMTPTQ